MVKYYCVCCGEETDKIFRFSYYCHLNPSGKRRGQNDMKSNQPGREEFRDLCITCYNKIVSKAIAEYKRLYELQI